MHSVRKREAVMSGIPIAKLVAGGKARDPKRRSIRNGTGEIRGRASFAQSGEHRVDDSLRIVAEDRWHESVAIGPATTRTPAEIERLWNGRECGLDQ